MRGSAFAAPLVGIVATAANRVRMKGCKMPPARTTADEGTGLDDLRKSLEQRLGVRRFQNWFGQTTQFELCGSELVVHVRSPYLVKWMQRQYGALLNQLVCRFLGPAFTVRYEIGGEVALSPVCPEEANASLPAASVARKTGSEAKDARASRGRRGYSLNDLVVGEANALAITALHAVIDEPGRVSPVYLHGNVGTGKTHCLEGLRSRLRKEYPQLQVLSLTAEQFGNYFSQALDSKSLPSFRAKFRNVDVLLVDDVDFFDGKPGFQEEFLHTMKQFEEAGRQVVLSSGRHPRLLTRTTDELVTRFLAGVVCRLDAPDVEMRREIAVRHARRQKCDFSAETLEHVANRFSANIRELEGAVNLLGTWGLMSGQTVGLGAARKILSRLERDCLRIVGLSDIEEAVCEFFGVDSRELRSASRKQQVTQPRMLAMYLSRRLTQTAYSEIGRHFGGRNHATVMSAERKVQKEIESQATIRVASEKWTVGDVVQALEQRIKAG